MTSVSRKADSLFLDSQMFISVLDKELTRAERYNHYVSILLLRVEGVPGQERAFWLVRLASALADKVVRKSDYLGTFKKGTLGIILACAGVKSTRIVQERLRFEALMRLSGGPQEIHLKTSYAVYPSEATLLESLCDLAIQRLTDQEYNA